MATANVRTTFDMPSPLAVDLALARVDLAAVRARRGVHVVDQEARDSAVLLKDFFSRQLRIASSSAQITDALVPDENVRQVIRECMASITETKPPLDAGDADLLRELVGLLSALGETGRCEREQAKNLHSALRRLDAKLAAPSPRTDETKLWELLNAFS